MYAPEYIESGLIYDITDLVKKDGVDLSKFPATVTSMDECVDDLTIYRIGQTGHDHTQLHSSIGCHELTL